MPVKEPQRRSTRLRDMARELWHRLLRRSASESGRLCHGDAGREWGARRPRALMLPILLPMRQPYLVPCGTERKEEDAIHHTLQVCRKSHAHVGETLLNESRHQAEEK